MTRVWRASVVALLLASEDYVVDEDAARQSSRKHLVRRLRYAIGLAFPTPKPMIQRST